MILSFLSHNLTQKVLKCDTYFSLNNGTFHMAEGSSCFTSADKSA